MTERASSPLTAAVGLVAATADGVRKLPSLLAGLPPAVVRELTGATAAARHRYDELALHGRDVLAARQRGGAVTAPRPPADEPVDIVVEDAVDDRTAPAAVAAVAEPETAPPAPTPPPGLTEPVVLPEEVLEDVAQLTPGDELDHADLPLEDFDHQTLPQLRGRLRTLGLPDLVQLRDYEQAHAARLPVLTLLDNRIAKLLAEPDGQ